MFSRTEWAIWLLGLKRSSEPVERGLILIQIDGLSKHQLEQALNNGRMPFLRHLIQKERYLNHRFYSGLPASTPAVQGELYYGHPTVVPAFGFRDHRNGRLTRMFENEIAQEVEAKLGRETPGLLSGGSSYCNNYGGGADDVHFCATSFGWSEFLSALNPFQLLVVMVLNVVMFLRVAALTVVEVFLALGGFFRGVVNGRQFWQELIMIPARVVIVVLLRELVTTGACYDAARGLPIVHLNYLGYDEQAHRRGPGSRFAHWTLRGIDRCIRRIWKSAHQGAGREYDIWVFSDHGQETTVPYQLSHGQLVQQVVADFVDPRCGGADSPPPATRAGRIPTRAHWLGIGWLVSMLFGEQDHDIQDRSPNVQTVTSGPLGFVYLLNDRAQSVAEELATFLVREADVPMVVRAEGKRAARVDTAEGQFQLPRDAIQVFGADHPFLHEVCQDLIRLAGHVDAGQMILVGWTNERESTSFVLQNGAHAGPGTEETQAFVMLPADVPLPDSSKNYLRPNDLRIAAMHFLSREERPARRIQGISANHPIRVMTYNVHACVGMDGELSPERIARVIAQSGANIVCLQELDVFRRRSGNRDQAHAIAEHLEMSFQFHPAWRLEEERFGNAILSRFPMRVVMERGIHHYKEDRSRRSALWVEVDIDPQVSLQVINTHLSIYPKEQLIQARELVEEWIEPAKLLGPVILCGDFNARPNSATHKAFAKAMQDVETFTAGKTRATYFSPFPFTRVDHIFVTPELQATSLQIVKTRMAKVASDHLPLMADLKIDASALAALNDQAQDNKPD